MYDVKLKRKWDRYNILTTAWQEGYVQGLIEGTARRLGKAENSDEVKEEVIIIGHKEGVSDETMHRIIGWCEDHIREVRRRYYKDIGEEPSKEKIERAKKFHWKEIQRTLYQQKK